MDSNIRHLHNCTTTTKQRHGTTTTRRGHDKLSTARQQHAQNTVNSRPPHHRYIYHQIQVPRRRLRRGNQTTMNNVRRRVLFDTTGKHTCSTFVPIHLADNNNCFSTTSHHDDTSGNHARCSRTHDLSATMTVPTVEEAKTMTIHNRSRMMVSTNERN